jgi:hypothetical protein
MLKSLLACAFNAEYNQRRIRDFAMQIHLLAEQNILQVIIEARNKLLIAEQAKRDKIKIKTGKSPMVQALPRAIRLKFTFSDDMGADLFIFTPAGQCNTDVGIACGAVGVDAVDQRENPIPRHGASEKPVGADGSSGTGDSA